MKNTVKRMLAVFLCLITVLAMIPAVSAAEDTAKLFDDVQKSDWFYKNGAINFVYNNDLFKGTSKSKFSPNDNMTRAMFVTVLGRLDGVKVNNKVTTRFVDAPKGQYYTGYVKWAADNGIVNGVEDAEYGPDQNITREQICVMMTRYCAYARVELEQLNKSITFKDSADISSYARAAVSLCQQSGLVNGEKSGNGYKFRPQGNATRAEVATILMNFAKKYTVHEWTESETVSEDTCVSVTNYTCSHCEEIKSVVNTTHKLNIQAAVKATCTKNGKTAGVSCTACGKVFAKSKTIAKTGHNWKAATCDAPKKCKTCGATSGAAQGHDMNSGVCSRCGLEMDVYNAAGYASAVLLDSLDPADTMYLLEARYVKGCKESSGAGNCANGVYTFYFVYQIGQYGSKQYAIIGIHADEEYIYYRGAHDGNSRAEYGSVLEIQKVIDNANAWLSYGV